MSVAGTQIRDGSLQPVDISLYAADGGSSDAYAISFIPALASYPTGIEIVFKANTANTGAASLNVNSLGAKTIKKNGSSDLADNDIAAGQIVTVVYDGTYWQLQSPVSNTDLSGYQPLDSDLTALAALAATAGFLSRTGAGAFAVRTLTGTTNQISIANPTGASGDPVFSLPQSIATTSTPAFARLGIGGASNAAVGIAFPAGLSLTGTAQYGITVSGWAGTSAATAEIVGAYFRPATAAAAYTCAAASGLQVDNAAVGSGSTITTQYGLKIENLTSAGTNYSIYAGTAACYFGGPMRFANFGAGTATFNASGNISSGQSVAAGAVPAFNGIAFPATQVDAAEANTLDDYEEGTWTPGISFGGGTTGITYSTQVGKYTKIGRIVTLTGYMILSSKGSSTGSARITGLPFAVPSNNANLLVCSMYYYNITLPASKYGVIIYGLVGTSTAYALTNGGTDSDTVLTDAAFSDASQLGGFTLTYFVN